MRRIVVSLALAFAPMAFAAEGMWTLDNLPMADMAKAYGFKPDNAWITHSMHSAARLAGGCSGSFVSADGLVLTNHHCVIGCVKNLSSKEHDYVGNGFLAAARDGEKQCPGAEIDRLEQTTDVTTRIGKATAGLTGKPYNDAKKTEQARIESECVGSDSKNLRCDVVELYQGGVQHLYKYTRFQDVRLAFAPEYRAGFFGGDPDNFNFPRYNLDMGLLRVYVDGKPARIKDFFPINTDGAQPGELVMTLGHPGSTQRLLTIAQLEFQRDIALPFRVMFASELRGFLTAFGNVNAENRRISQTDLFGVENGIKVRWGQFNALLDTAVFAGKRAEETSLREFVAADAARVKAIGDPWAAIATAQATERQIYLPYIMTEGGLGFLSQHLGFAKILVRGAAERPKPNGERLREFGEAGLPAVEATLLAQAPIYPDYEKARLAWSLTKLREELGTDNAFVKQVLGQDSPDVLAAKIVDGSKLGDVAVRKSLWEGGQRAIAASTDPAIVLMQRADAAMRELRARYETEVESVEKRQAEVLAQARFAQKGTGVYPDATFSLRLSHGVIRGWDENGMPVPPYTDFSGLYARATDYDPYRLAPKWIAARTKVSPDTRFDQVSTNDIIGGNSGSPLINARGQIVGLVFDGNIHSLGGAFYFDEAQNRSISVHPAAIASALRKVYSADRLADELGFK